MATGNILYCIHGFHYLLLESSVSKKSEEADYHCEQDHPYLLVEEICFPKSLEDMGEKRRDKKQHGAGRQKN